MGPNAPPHADPAGIVFHPFSWFPFAGLGIAVATHCEPCILVHLEKAIASGASKAEILEACAVAIAMGGGPAMAYLPLVLKYLEEHPS